MKKSKGALTAEELLARLETDPSSQENRLKREREMNERATVLGQAEEEMVRDLRQLGYQVRSVWDLVNSNDSYPSALPVLLHHLHKPYPDAIRDGIARALAVKSAKSAWDVLMAEYVVTQESCEPRFKQGLAVALSVTYDHSHFEDIRQLLTEKRHGDSRILLLRPFQNSTRPSVLKMIEQLAEDPTFEKEIRSWYRNRKRVG